LSLVLHGRDAGSNQVGLLPVSGLPFVEQLELKSSLKQLGLLNQVLSDQDFTVKTMFIAIGTLNHV
jgi:hypothetical protein